MDETAGERVAAHKDWNAKDVTEQSQDRCETSYSYTCTFRVKQKPRDATGRNLERKYRRTGRAPALHTCLFLRYQAR